MPAELSSDPAKPPLVVPNSDRDDLSLPTPSAPLTAQ